MHVQALLTGCSCLQGIFVRPSLIVPRNVHQGLCPFAPIGKGEVVWFYLGALVPGTVKEVVQTTEASGEGFNEVTPNSFRKWRIPVEKLVVNSKDVMARIWIVTDVAVYHLLPSTSTFLEIMQLRRRLR